MLMRKWLSDMSKDELWDEFDQVTKDFSDEQTWDIVNREEPKGIPKKNPNLQRAKNIINYLKTEGDEVLVL